MPYKKIQNKLSFLIMLFLLVYLFFALQYPVNEFSRPYVVCLYILAASIIVVIACRRTTLLSSMPTKELARTGFLIGAVISLAFLASNYVFQTEVPLRYEIMSITQGRGYSVNWKVKTNQGESFSLNVRSNFASTNQEPIFYRGTWGYYFGEQNKSR